MATRVAGWLLRPEDRDRLMAVFPPAYPRSVAHHVTLKAGVRPGFPPRETDGFVVGAADDGAGVQALVVEIGGTTRRRDGSVHHIKPAAGIGPGAAHGLLSAFGGDETGPPSSVRASCVGDREGPFGSADGFTLQPSS